jgi:hypothetical protein
MKLILILPNIWIANIYLTNLKVTENWSWSRNLISTLNKKQCYNYRSHVSLQACAMTQHLANYKFSCLRNPNQIPSNEYWTKPEWLAKKARTSQNLCDIVQTKLNKLQSFRSATKESKAWHYEKPRICPNSWFSCIAK